MAGRGRGDDDPSVVEKRFKTYENDTLPIVKQYEEKGKLVRVDANGTKEERDREGTIRHHRRREFVVRRKIELTENQRCRHPVDEIVIPLDRRALETGNHNTTHGSIRKRLLFAHGMGWL